MPENASSIIDIFTCEQPDYGFAAGVTYTVQVCEGGTEFEKFESLPTTGSGEKVLIKTFSPEPVVGSDSNFSNSVPPSQTCTVYVTPAAKP